MSTTLVESINSFRVGQFTFFNSTRASFMNWIIFIYNKISGYAANFSFEQ